MSVISMPPHRRLIFWKINDSREIHNIHRVRLAFPHIHINAQRRVWMTFPDLPDRCRENERYRVPLPNIQGTYTCFGADPIYNPLASFFGTTFKIYNDDYHEIDGNIRNAKERANCSTYEEFFQQWAEGGLPFLEKIAERV